MFGSDVVDTGVSTMNYSYEGAYATHYTGSWELEQTGCDWCANVQISYTTTQMKVSETQTLTATSDSEETNDYQWSTDNGSVDPATGPYTVFSSPATNPDCGANATITLKCKDSAGNFNVADTLTISVNAVTASNVGKFCTITTKGSCQIRGVPPAYWEWVSLVAKRYVVNCDGAVTLSGVYEQPWITCFCTYDQVEPCAAALANAISAIGCTVWDEWCDDRSAAQKSAGCCPEQVLGQPAC